MNKIIAVATLFFLICCNRHSSQTSGTKPDSIATAYSLLSSKYEEVISLWPEVDLEDCRVLAQVKHVYRINETGRQKPPCDEYPCRARIRIIEIEKTGESFIGDVAAAQELDVDFIYSLAPTAKSFPEMEPPLKGLELGEVFRADIKAQKDIKGKGIKYFISKYMNEDD